jgi:C4-type Zn-finger protein
MFKICPVCENDKLKMKLLEKREYNPSTGAVRIEEDVPVAEYHCQVCGWTALVEDPVISQSR